MLVPDGGPGQPQLEQSLVGGFGSSGPKPNIAEDNWWESSVHTAANNANVRTANFGGDTGGRDLQKQSSSHFYKSAAQYEKIE